MTTNRFDSTEGLRPFHAGRSREMNAEVASPHAEQPLAFDVYRVADELCIDFDAPGVDPSTIHLALENQFLTVSVQRELNGSGIEVIERGRVHGNFEQQLILPGHWDIDQLRASYTNGVLHLTAPLRSSEPSRMIEVELSQPVGDPSFSFRSATPDHSDDVDVDADEQPQTIGSAA
jgi:HSP20 family protein